jgi:hypothetical protein
MLHSFGGSGDGTHPFDGLVNVKRRLYGMTHNGGANKQGNCLLVKAVKPNINMR